MCIMHVLPVTCQLNSAELSQSLAEVLDELPFFCPREKKTPSTTPFSRYPRARRHSRESRRNRRLRNCPERDKDRKPCGRLSSRPLERSPKLPCDRRRHSRGRNEDLDRIVRKRAPKKFPSSHDFPDISRYSASSTLYPESIRRCDNARYHGAS